MDAIRVLSYGAMGLLVRPRHYRAMTPLLVGHRVRERARTSAAALGAWSTVARGTGP